MRTPCGRLISHCFFLRRSFAAPFRTHGGANESGSRKYSGSWHAGGNSTMRDPPTFFPPSPPERKPARQVRRKRERLSKDASTSTGIGILGSRIQLQQRYCSRFSRDFSRRSTDQTRKELPREVGPCAWPLKIYLCGRVPCPCAFRFGYFTFPSQPPRHRRRRFHWLESRLGIAEGIPESTPNGDRRFPLR